MSNIDVPRHPIPHGARAHGGAGAAHRLHGAGRSAPRGCGDHEKARRRAGAAVHQGRRLRPAGDRQPALLPSQLRSRLRSTSTASGRSSAASAPEAAGAGGWPAARPHQGHRPSAHAAALHRTAEDAGRFVTGDRDRTRSRHRHLQRPITVCSSSAGPAPASSSTTAGTCGSPSSAPSKGEALPIAVCIGSDLALHYTAATMGSQMPEHADEIAAAAGFAAVRCR